MQSVNLIAGSTEYVKSRVVVTKDAQPYDPTGCAVHWAFVPAGNSLESDTEWTAGSWESTGGRHWARCLVGVAGDVALARGTWKAYWRVTDNPELPIECAGMIVVK